MEFIFQIVMTTRVGMLVGEGIIFGFSWCLLKGFLYRPNVAERIGFIESALIGMLAGAVAGVSFVPCESVIAYYQCSPNTGNGIGVIKSALVGMFAGTGIIVGLCWSLLRIHLHGPKGGGVIGIVKSAFVGMLGGAGIGVGFVLCLCVLEYFRSGPPVSEVMGITGLGIIKSALVGLLAGGITGFIFGPCLCRLENFVYGTQTGDAKGTINSVLLLIESTLVGMLSGAGAGVVFGLCVYLLVSSLARPEPEAALVVIVLPILGAAVGLGTGLALGGFRFAQKWLPKRKSALS